MRKRQMNAVQLTSTGRPVELRRVDVPDIGAGDVRVRVRAAGVCHSDAHYRAGTTPVGKLPLTLGHEVAGEVEDMGGDVSQFKLGDRVCIHYMISCGSCEQCRGGREQLCVSGSMVGKDRDGGFAEYIVVPERNAIALPDGVPFEAAAVMMCSSATALHAIYQSRLAAGENVAVFGIGGLGASAIQLARIAGAGEIYAVDIRSPKLALAERMGAVPINAEESDPVEQIMHLTKNRGVDVAFEMVGLPATIQHAVGSLAVGGRAVIAGITDQNVEVAPYDQLVRREAEIIGVSDHTVKEIHQLISWYGEGKLSFSDGIISTGPLEENVVNHALDNLDGFGDTIRVVVTP